MKKLQRSIRAIAAAMLMGTAFSLTSCDVMLDVLGGMATGMAYYNPYSYTSSFGVSTNNNYLLDPNYAIWQTQQQQAEFDAVNQQLIDLSIKQVERENEEEYWAMTGGQISREEWNAIKAQALMESNGQDGGITIFSSDEYQGELSPSQYEDIYHRYEKSVQGWYNNLNTSGIKGEDSQGNIKGKTNSGDLQVGGTYVTNQMGLKKTQKEMERIRLEAEKYGVHIQQSKWETATAGY